MPGKTKEPQSYGSQRDWVTGRTGEQPNDPKSAPTEEHRDFYADERESEWNAPYQGGRVSKASLDDTGRWAGSSGRTRESGGAVTTDEGGAKRNSYFKKRDYE
ncbi:MAG: hypothetical protein WA208_02895 [Thermoanaerobaculia bacterium]